MAKHLLFAAPMLVWLIGLSAPIIYVVAVIGDRTGWYRVENHLSYDDH